MLEKDILLSEKEGNFDQIQQQKLIWSLDQSRLIGVTCINLKDLPSDQLDLDTLEPVAPGEIVNIVVEEDEEDDPLE